MNTVQPRQEFPANPASQARRWSGLVFGLVGVTLVLYLDGRVQHVHGLPSLSQDMSYGLLFAVGLLTGFHCVGMCGAMVLSYTTKMAGGGRLSPWAHLFYGTGKTLSYMVIGAGFGWLGSIVAFTPLLRGIIGIAAGVFLVLFGLGMLNVLPSLSGFGMRTPRFLLRFIGTQSRKYGHPFIIGLLNGLMIICGPLQAMYIMAAGSGNALRGALMLFTFGLGTLPMMVGFGMFAGMVSKELTPKLIKASAVIVVALGALMFNRGLKMSETGVDFDSLRFRAFRAVAMQWNAWHDDALRAGIELPEIPLPENPQTAAIKPQEIQTMLMESGATPDEYRLLLGKPVRWTIEVHELPEDMARINIPEWRLDVALHLGSQVIEFTPDRIGIATWHSLSGSPVARFLVEDPRTSFMHVH
jgi:sulfite exporter TauE/SafE